MNNIITGKEATGGDMLYVAIVAAVTILCLIEMVRTAICLYLTNKSKAINPDTGITDYLTATTIILLLLAIRGVMDMHVFDAVWYRAAMATLKLVPPVIAIYINRCVIISACSGKIGIYRRSRKHNRKKPLNRIMP